MISLATFRNVIKLKNFQDVSGKNGRRVHILSGPYPKKGDTVMTNENYSFIRHLTTYHRRCTDAPIQYSEHLGVLLLGHAMGYEPINLIQPKAVRHNLYLDFVGV